MKIVELPGKLTLFVFNPVNKDDYFGNKITVLKDQDKALCIDTGYKDQFLMVKEHLEREGYTLTDIVLTHFHDDHAEGLETLPSNVTTYGSIHYQVTLNGYTPKAKHAFYRPTHTIDKKTSITFGSHTLTLIPHRGHSVDGLLVDIDHQTMHIGDEVMFSNHGDPLLPAIRYDDIPYQLISYQLLKKYQADYRFIYGHGLEVDDALFNQTLNDLTTYLTRILEAKGTLSYKDATNKLKTSFKQTSWHTMMTR